MEEILKKKAFPDPKDNLVFSDSHRPPLQSGNYVIEVSQKVELKNISEEKADITETWQKKPQKFSVESEQFHLSPDEVNSVYPPKGSDGDYWTCLPHIVLNRSTLPWERTALNQPNDPQKDPPWLALVVLHPEELSETSIFTDSIENFNDSKSLTIGKGVELKDTINLIKVSWDLLPTQEELALLTHVRQREAILSEDEADLLSKDGNYKIIEKEDKKYLLVHETASIIANRLPHPKGKNVVHLVSLEGLYGEKQNEPPSGEITLVSLYQWQFYCQEETRNFKVVMEGLNVDNAAEFRVPLPENANISKPFLDSGFVSLKHRFREGSRGRSWYHGPLIPVETTLDIHNMQPIADMHLRHADQLLVFDEKSGFFDVSYAAAWQLGRLLTLQNTKLALAQLEWKKRNSQALHSAIHQVDYGYDLAKKNELFKEDTKGKMIAEWLDELTMLKHIPFQYLVPDEALLPPESIRFFSIDPHWIECLRDGAFSIGRVLEHGEHSDQLPEKLDINLTGFLMRSEAVSGWPQLVMNAYERNSTTFKGTEKQEISSADSENVFLPIRKEVIGKNVMLVLFDQEIAAVDFYLPPEHLHFGFDLEESQSGKASDNPEKLTKSKRDIKGKEIEGEPINISLREGNKRIVNISALLESLADNPDLGTLAIQLMNGTDIIRFTRNSNKTN